MSVNERRGEGGGCVWREEELAGNEAGCRRTGPCASAISAQEPALIAVGNRR